MKPEEIKYVVVHCSKTSRKYGDGLAAVERKCRERGAMSCGYHFVIGRDGKLETGRPLHEAGNHLLGLNQNSLGVCLVGTPSRITGTQKKTLWTLLEILAEQFPNAKQVTHEELQPVAGRGCPGFKLKTFQKGK